jgi:hypothetical protein
MAVPSGHHIYPYGNAQTQGGTILNNDNTSTDRITKAFQLNDAVAVAPDTNMLPSIGASGIYNVHKPLTAGTFGYSVAGQYVIKGSSTSLSGVTKNAILFTANDRQARPIARFMGDYGAKLLTAWRQNQFSWTHTLDSGAKITQMRSNWLNSTGDHAVSVPSLSRLNNNGGSQTNGMWDPVAGAISANSDSAANPIRSVPGELVMLNDFVNANISTSGNFFDYKPITGM